MVEMKVDDSLTNTYEIHSFVQSQVTRFGNLIGTTLSPVLEKLAEEIGNLDDEKVNKLTSSIEKIFKKIKI
jgi:hypothetical protein